MARPKLHLDACVSNLKLYAALLNRGHDVSCTPTAWIRHDASDLEQVLAATAQGRCIYTMNAKDFQRIGQHYPEHHGIILASQPHWSLTAQINALDKLLRETDAEDWIGQIRWLNQWR